MVCALLALVSCKKNKKQIFISDFNSQTDLEQWSVDTGGDVTLENGTAYFSNLNSCFNLDVKELISVRKNQSYIIKLKSKHNPSQIGDPSFCVGDLTFWVRQDSEMLLMDKANSSGNFVEEQFTFTTLSDSPIEVRFFIGTTHGAWLDYVIIEKV